ncbi:hypothetical protein acsn021_01790 [Anaerocolumna cellulosilytica]|uniref:Immunity MXAN-0049 protein domain-containing protein n=1 Tax=Anaerocolumna cellulosilytica TaxID=433286 RepID=A0A6S6QZT3_9FIRM|nr:hypothetical protein [Anaerocolumna cellulosilytica]MBB5197917.1 hypothetical protein [Anaerocolumna cellulosilytica]BCJ92610.1 hypothetical protein acsn021_01790 [Anaerocolumna cellulosilytica]
MRYFLLKADKGYTYTPRIVNLHTQIDVRDLKKGSYYKIPKRFLLRIQSNPDTVYTDIITHPLFLISDKIKRVLEKYEPNLNYKEVILLDQEFGRAEKYHLPTLEELECLTPASVFNTDKSILHKIVIDINKSGDKCMFALGEVTNRYVIVRLDFVESMLRRGAKGFTLQEVETVKGGD